MQPAREQMPGSFRRLDDPWGVVWRLRNAGLRFSPARSARLLYYRLRGTHWQRPVFIIGAPRSGTTMVVQVLAASDELGSLGREGHDVWRAFHHPRRSHWRSDRVGAGELRRGERRFVEAYFASYVTAPRFVDKTPENALRVPYLLDLFPDAIFVVVARNPCDVINSLINGWRDPGGRFRSYFVPDRLHIPGYGPHHQWCFALIDGWRSLRSSPVHHIAFAQWEQHIRGVADARRLVAPSRWLELHFEHILAEPERQLARLCEVAGIRNQRALAAKLGALVADPVNALTEPRAEKWRRENASELRELLPAISRLAGQAGYRVDPATGAFEVLGQTIGSTRS